MRRCGLTVGRGFIDSLQRRLAERLPELIHRMDQLYRWTSGRLQTPRGLMHLLDSDLLAERPELARIRELRDRFFPPRAKADEAPVEFTHPIIHPAPLAHTMGAHDPEDEPPPPSDVVPVDRLKKRT